MPTEGHPITDPPQRRRRWRRWTGAAVVVLITLGAIRLFLVSPGDARLISLSRGLRFGNSPDEACAIMQRDHDVIANLVFAPGTGDVAAIRFYASPTRFENRIRNGIARLGFLLPDRYPVEVRFNRDRIADQIRRGTEVVEAPLNVNE
jgi:hypothetical protein